MTFDAIFVPEEFRAAVSDRAWVEAMLEVERALVNAESRVGVVPAHLAGPIAEACRVELFDVEAIVAAGRLAGNPAEPLVRALREVVGGEAAGYVHYGATSQDIVDSAAMLVAQRALRLIDARLTGVSAACARFAETYRLTPMVARTLLQQAVPTTFGYKAARWLVPLVKARVRLSQLREGLPAQLGGAAGTLAALGGDGTKVTGLFAHELELEQLVVPWHTDRSEVAELGSALAVVTGTCAKIGYDLALLEQFEVAEVREPAGEGSSSTMPNKRNPVGAAVAIACFRHVDAAAGVLLRGMLSEHERGLGSWQAEWEALSTALAYTGGAIAAVGETLESLEVDPGRMLANLEASRGAVMSEHAMFVLAGHVGLTRAREIVEAALVDVAAGGTLGQALSGEMSADELDDVLVPTAYLGSACEFVDRALDYYKEHGR